MGSSIINYQVSRVPNNSEVILKKSNTAVSSGTAGGTIELLNARYTVPGGLMGPNDSIYIRTLWSCTNNANAKTGIISWGTDSNDIVSNSIVSATGWWSVAEIHNNNSTSAQKCRYRFYTAGEPFTEYNGAVNESFAVDTSADTNILFYASGLTAGDEVILESYVIKLLRAV